MTNREYIKFQDIKFYWHPFSKYYLASKSGKILSLKRREKRILKLFKRRDGYIQFIFCENNKKRIYLVHRFVYECFKDTIPKGMETDHIDGDKKNNSIFNLQLLSKKDNIKKSICKKVISYNIKTKEEKIFDSLTQAAEFYQIKISLVCYNCQKKIKITKSKKDGQRYQFFYFKN